ncbi:MAG: bifunctional 5,10-methylenetetrahydrofolate dehydrogenase/5,10-methenyltetrahydrofolate cyclohydrolase [Phycisphaerales bacterium]|nr:bifunctional 5,10-methylenetetrahydrofolate dehydrogenase/5,10-methenyltetrahydrofolate cyclohydrolase [Phycisphaerales bacterium]
MSAKLIDGKSLANKIRNDIATEVAQLKAAGKPVRLAAILMGSSPAALVYAESQKKSAAQVNIDFELHQLPDTATEDDLHDTIQTLNCNPQVTGIFLHSPLTNGLNLQKAQEKIDLYKDVEAVNPANLGHIIHGNTILAPCTPLACVELIDSTGFDLIGATITIVGASRIVGRPLALLLMERRATVTLCNSKTRDLTAACKNADIVIVAVGKPNILLAEHVKPGAIVIDVGINRVNTGGGVKTVGDADFENISKIAGYITPVPGGVGPMTVAMLLKNTLRAAKLVHQNDR